MEAKTIIYAGLFELPDQDAAAHRVHGIGKILQAIGYKIIYVGLCRNSATLLQEHNYGNVKFVAEKYPEKSSDWLKCKLDSSALIDTINKCEDVEGVILYNYPSFTFDKIRRICRKRNIKLYADCTEWYHSGKNERLFWVKNIETFKRMHFDNKRVDGLIVISSYLAEYYSKCNVIKIPPVFDYEQIRNNQLVYEPNQRRTFVFTGTISLQKETVAEIVKAACILKKENQNFRVRIFGVSKEDFIKKFTGDFDIPHEVEFFGTVSHEHCLYEIQCADYQIFVRQATRVNMAGFPTKFAESFSCGTPVVTTKTSDLSDYLVNGKTGFFIESNIVETMREAIILEDAKLVEMHANVKMCKSFDFRQYIDKVASWITR